MVENNKGFGILFKGGSQKDLADRVLPEKETLSKPSSKNKKNSKQDKDKVSPGFGSCPGPHGPRGGRHGPHGEPPGLHGGPHGPGGAVIMIGMSIEEENKKRGKHKKGEETKKAFVDPGTFQDSSHTWRPAPRSKLNKMRLWDSKHGKWTYRDRTSKDDQVWGVPPGAEPAPAVKQKEYEPETKVKQEKPVEEEKQKEFGGKKETVDFDQKKVLESSSKLQNLLSGKKKQLLASEKKDKKKIKRKPFKRIED